LSGYSSVYAIGGLGGFQGADGINPIELFILVGNGDRQYLQSHYFDASIMPMGTIQTIIPPRPDHEDNLLDACIVFCPKYFRDCASFAEVEKSLPIANVLDFDSKTEKIPVAWAALREEARPFFNDMNIWCADFVRVNNL
jgi:hypothetical protein